MNRSKESNQEKCIRNYQETRDADAQSDKCSKGQENRGLKSASAITKKQRMRMPKIQRNEPVEGIKSRKVHPQLPRSKRCGCPIRQMLKEPRDQRLEKCIRNYQEAGNADAQSGKCWKNQEIRGLKSASATAKKKRMRMHDQTRSGQSKCWKEPRDQKQGICILGADAASINPDLQMREDDRI